MDKYRSSKIWPCFKRCLLLGGSLTKIVTCGTKHFVRYSRHVRYLGCLLLGGFTVLENLKAPHSLLLLVFFTEAEERGCVSFMLSACFSMIQYSRKKSLMKYHLSSTIIIVINVASQLKPRFHVMLVLCNCISKMAYYKRRKARIWSWISRSRFSSRKRKDICFRIKSLSTVTYNMSNWKNSTNLMC